MLWFLLFEVLREGQMGWNTAVKSKAGIKEQVVWWWRRPPTAVAAGRTPDLIHLVLKYQTGGNQNPDINRDIKENPKNPSVPYHQSFESYFVEDLRQIYHIWLEILYLVFISNWPFSWTFPVRTQMWHRTSSCTSPSRKCENIQHAFWSIRAIARPDALEKCPSLLWSAPDSDSSPSAFFICWTTPEFSFGQGPGLVWPRKKERAGDAAKWRAFHVGLLTLWAT